MKCLRLSILFSLVAMFPLRGLVLESIIERGQLQVVFRNKVIGCFLGTFNPLHAAHQEMAEIAIEKKFCDYVIVYPTWGGDDYKKDKLPVDVRLDMIYSTFSEHPRIIVTRLTPIELQNVLTQSCDEGEKRRPRFANEFIGIMGSDLAVGLARPMDTFEAEDYRIRHLSVYMRGVPIPQQYEEHSLGSVMSLPARAFVVFIREPEDEVFLSRKMEIGDRKILSLLKMREDKTWISSTIIRGAVARISSPVSRGSVGLQGSPILRGFQNSPVSRRRSIESSSGSLSSMDSLEEVLPEGVCRMIRQNSLYFEDELGFC